MLLSILFKTQSIPKKTILVGIFIKLNWEKVRMTEKKAKHSRIKIFEIVYNKGDSPYFCN